MRTTYKKQYLDHECRQCGFRFPFNYQGRVTEAIGLFCSSDCAFKFKQDNGLFPKKEVIK